MRVEAMVTPPVPPTMISSAGMLSSPIGLPPSRMTASNSDAIAPPIPIAVICFTEGLRSFGLRAAVRGRGAYAARGLSAVQPGTSARQRELLVGRGGVAEDARVPVAHPLRDLFRGLEDDELRPVRQHHDRVGMRLDHVDRVGVEAEGLVGVCEAVQDDHDVLLSENEGGGRGRPPPTSSTVSA